MFYASIGTIERVFVCVNMSVYHTKSLCWIYKQTIFINLLENIRQSLIASNLVMYALLHPHQFRAWQHPDRAVREHAHWVFGDHALFDNLVQIDDLDGSAGFLVIRQIHNSAEESSSFPPEGRR